MFAHITTQLEMAGKEDWGVCISTTVADKQVDAIINAALSQGAV